MAYQVRVTSRIVVRAEAGQVWRAAVDWPGQRRWMLATRVHGDQGPGARVVARTGIGPVGFTDTMVVTQWDPPRRCVLRHTGRLVRGAGIFEVSAGDLDTEFRWTEQLELPFGAAGRLGWWLIRPLAQRGMDVSLRRFARLITG